MGLRVVVVGCWRRRQLVQVHEGRWVAVVMFRFEAAVLAAEKVLQRIRDLSMAVVLRPATRVGEREEVAAFNAVNFPERCRRRRWSGEAGVNAPGSPL